MDALLPPRTLVLIPAFNEAANLPATVAELRGAFPDAAVLVIDDGSSDGTTTAAAALGVRVITNPTNLGIGGAVQAGFRYALEYGYDFAIEHDADGQHDPAFIPALLAPVAAGAADVAIGSRFLGHGGYRPRGFRLVGSKYFSLLCSLLAGKRYRDITSGQWALNRRALSFVARYFPVDYPDAQAVLAVHRAGLRVVEVPVRMRDRLSGVSTTNLARSLVYPLQVTIAIFAESLRRPYRLPPEA